MDKFVLKSKMEPKGDQPGAIKSLVKGIKDGKRFQTLLGGTGTGKAKGKAKSMAMKKKVK